MTNPMLSIAERAGRLVGLYSRWAVRPRRIFVEGIDLLPEQAAIYIGWHGGNMVALAVQRTLQPESVFQAFVPSGMTGAAMRGWLAAVGDIRQVLIEEESAASMRTAVGTMARGLARGQNVMIAVDGPAGPARIVRPGALWLARLTGRPLVPMGFAASPAGRVPRWDRQIVPFFGARVTASICPPIWLKKDQPIEPPLLEKIGAVLDAATERAQEMLVAPAGLNHHLARRSK
jgi:lysophospholipid acyltransferase (LPLAT)-like uncharacterized protein